MWRIETTLLYTQFRQPGIEQGIGSAVCLFRAAAANRTLEAQGITVEPIGTADIAPKVSVVLECLVDTLLLTVYIDNLIYCELAVGQNLIYLFPGDIIEMNTSNNADRSSGRFT